MGLAHTWFHLFRPYFITFLTKVHLLVALTRIEFKLISFCLSLFKKVSGVNILFRIILLVLIATASATSTSAYLSIISCTSLISSTSASLLWVNVVGILWQFLSMRLCLFLRDKVCLVILLRFLSLLRLWNPFHLLVSWSRVLSCLRTTTPSMPFSLVHNC